MKHFSGVVTIALLLNLSACGGGEEPDRPAPVAEAGPNQEVVHRGMVTVPGKGSSWDQRPVQFKWTLVEKPTDSVARLASVVEPEATFAADRPGTYRLSLIVNDGTKDSATDFVEVRYASEGNTSADVREIRDAWQELQGQLDATGDGTVIDLDPDFIYELDSALDLRTYRNVRINGHGAVIRRADVAKGSTRLTSLYLRTDYIDVEQVPESYRVGDTLVIASGPSDNELTLTPRTIRSIDGKRITVDFPFNEIFPVRSLVFKSYYLVTGLPSDVEGGTNPGTIIENVTFDGNAKGNQANFSWRVNPTIGLHGGMTSEIRYNRFVEIPNENIVGHGTDIHHNTFDGLNGSAFHVSLNQATKHLNGRASFRKNAVFEPNRILRHLNRHSEGAVTFSWGAGNLSIEDNLFVSVSGNFGVFGYLSGSAQNSAENLTAVRNQAYGFEYIIELNSPESTPLINVLITENVFESSGSVIGTNYQNNGTIRLGCNTTANGQPLAMGGESNHACN